VTTVVGDRSLGGRSLSWGKRTVRRLEAQTCFTTTTAKGCMVEGHSHGLDSNIKFFPVHAALLHSLEKTICLGGSVFAGFCWQIRGAAHSLRPSSRPDRQYGAVDSRTIRLQGIHSLLAVPVYRLSIRSSRNFAAADPCSAIGCSTVVSGGVVKAASGILSKPAMAMS
jgi:hypothetical protein